MLPRIIGEHLLKKTEAKERRVGMVFLSNEIVDDNILVMGNGVHALVYRDFINQLNQKRKEKVTQEEKDSILERAVDLLMKDDSILIRPNPERMDLAFEADEFLQGIVPKHKIKYLGVLDERVRKAIKQRGECWRINALPKTTDEMINEVINSKDSISERKMYYHSAETGTRYLTYNEFAKLGELDYGDIAKYLDEIKTYSGKTNRRGSSELEFFMADEFSFKDFENIDFKKLDKTELRKIYEQLKNKFQNSVKPEFRMDNPRSIEWRNAMLSKLIKANGDEISEEILLGLCPEFFMHIQWLPGARIEHGEVIFDYVFEQKEKHKELEELCDEKVKGLIFNFLREYDHIEYVNIGNVVESLAVKENSIRGKMPGRRGVYIAEIKIKGIDEEIVKVIRMQKRSIREYIEQGFDLPNATSKSENDTEYRFDRYIGCRQLGVNVLPIKAGKVYEKYKGNLIRSTYFERDYIYGIATDKISKSKYESNDFSIKLAELLGKAAASNIIVGRVFDGTVLFDDSDEVLVEKDGMPEDIILADLTATFRDFTTPLSEFAQAYAMPVNKRNKYVKCIEEFADVYIRNFIDRFKEIQNEYHKRKTAFDNLFIDRRLDDKDCFAYQWEKVLERLDKTDADELGDLIKKHISK